MDDIEIARAHEARKARAERIAANWESERDPHVGVIPSQWWGWPATLVFLLCVGGAASIF